MFIKSKNFFNSSIESISALSADITTLYAIGKLKWKGGNHGC